LSLSARGLRIVGQAADLDAQIFHQLSVAERDSLAFDAPLDTFAGSTPISVRG
jgi:hypothetical protein